jgi:predicted nuclease of predicted toxin-antitoxin system
VKLLIDMNLPVQWTEFLASAGWEAIHVSAIDAARTDAGVMDWARSNGYAVFTHGMNFGAMLRLCGERGPSVFEINAKDLMVPQLGGTVVRVLRQLEGELDAGALIEIDMETGRARVFKTGTSESS